MRNKWLRLGGTSAVLALTLASCAGGESGNDGTEAANGSGSDTVSILAVNNVQWLDLEKMLPEFTKQTGINADITLLPETDFRSRVTQELSMNAKQYDVISLSNYEVPIYAQNGWLEPLDALRDDAEYEIEDVFDSWLESFTVDDHLYAAPFTGESTFIMYRQDLFDKHDIDMPDRPTWDEVADRAKAIQEAEDGIHGICLRGKPGWSEMFAILGPVINTFGGTWFEEDWEAKVNAPEFTEAVEFYVDLIQNYGPPGGSEAGFSECFTAFTQEQVAIFFDDTAAANILESDGEPLQGRLGYAAAPTKVTDSGGMLYSWGWSIQNDSPNKDAAEEFIKWASGTEYDQLVADNFGWARVPAIKRHSTSEDPDYIEATAAFGEKAMDEILRADPDNAGTTPRPVPGVQFLIIPEFADLGTSVSAEIADAIAGRQTVQEALDKGQQLAEEVGAKYQD